MESPHTPHALRIQEMVKAIAAKKAGTPKPTLEQFNGDADAHGKAQELWRIAQEERLAQAVLDNGAATLSARERANKTLRRCERRRKKIEPIDSTPAHVIGVRQYPFPNWIDDANPVSELDEIPWAERFPYQDSQKSRYLTSDEARQQHENLCVLLDEFQRIGKMSPEARKAYWEKMESEHFARVEQARLDDSTSQPKFNPRSVK
jgi:hypothetical protein